MAEFDIAQFSNFKPPRYLCPRCLAVDTAVEESWIDWPEHWKTDSEVTTFSCHVCGLGYVTTNDFTDVHEYLKRWDCVIEHDELTKRFEALSDAAKYLRDGKLRQRLKYPALRSLFRLLNEARCFVHFVTWGMSWDFIGMLALMSHRVKVRGIVSRCDDNIARRIKDSLKYGGQGFEVAPLTFKEGSGSPHQKLLVIDGLVAVTGSANLTVNAWDNIDKGLEQSVVETKPSEVIRLNNSLFSPVWARLHPVKGKTVFMSRIGPTWLESITNLPK